MNSFRTLLLLLLFSYSSWLHALTYVPMADADLLARTPLVIDGKVRDLEYGRDPAGNVVTRYLVEVQALLKGELESGPVWVELPGGLDEQGNLSHVPGIPLLSGNERLLLFLQPTGRPAVFQVSQLVLGIFRHAVDDGGRQAWLRDLGDARAVADGRFLRSREAAQVRDARAFLDWIMAGGGESDYWLMAAPETFSSAPAPSLRYTLQVPDGTTHARWNLFDQGQGAGWLITDNGMPGFGTTEEVIPFLEKALGAWSNDLGSNIDYYFMGQMAVAEARLSSSNNEIRLEDPLNKIEGSYSSGGGVLGFGGWQASGTHRFAGATYWTIVSGWVTIQDGAGSSLARNGGEDLAEVIAHELGHTLGIGHSCGDPISPSCSDDPLYDDALMRSWMHSDGRGGSLGEDDKAAVAFLYPDPGAPEPVAADQCRWARESLSAGALPAAGDFYCDAEERIDLSGGALSPSRCVLRAPAVGLGTLQVPPGRELRVITP